MDDFLIAERKAGLTSYLNKLLALPEYNTSRLLQKFLSSSTYRVTVEVNLEDALPSTLSRQEALRIRKQLENTDSTAAATPIAAAYYPDWVDDTFPPEKLDYSKFDILFFGTCYR